MELCCIQDCYLLFSYVDICKISVLFKYFSLLIIYQTIKDALMLYNQWTYSLFIHFFPDLEIQTLCN